ncbi:megakaryocyte and platelet inhibitory receptor G6b [Emydura macquarii macquarii]|uniref:megakaryocyte and platelet inhibitory receptor G6b n=1 Tax=Emydura macquarii macquarii TaxID=1129001 RepID=UPI00352AE6BA
MGCWGWVLLGLLAPGPLRGSPPRLELGEAGAQVLLPCGAGPPPLRWVWSPRYPDCAGVTGDQLEIARLHPGPGPPLARFGGRLAPHPSAPGALLLRDLLMSDSGTFTCLGGAGAGRPTQLEVTGGCHHNLTVSSNWTSASVLTLHCQHCPPVAGPASYRWLLNHRPLGNQRWATKSHRGATVQLDPTRRAAWGRWECHLLATPTGAFEFCLAPTPGAKGPGPEAWMWVAVLLAVLVLGGAGLGAWRLRRRRRDREGRDRKKPEKDRGAPGPSFSLMEEPRLGDAPVPQPRSRERKVPDALLYTEVQHPPAACSPPPLQDGATVYATIV